MTPEQVIDIVCDTLSLQKDILICPNKCKGNRYAKYCYGRHIAIYFILEHSQKEIYLKDLAKMMGKFLRDGTGDHPSIIYSRKTVERVVLNKTFDPTLSEYFSLVDENIKKLSQNAA